MKLTQARSERRQSQRRPSHREESTEASSGIQETKQFISSLFTDPNLKRVLDVSIDTKPRLCDFDNVHNAKPIIKTSASDTSVFLATLGRNTASVNVAAKVFYTPIGVDIDNSLIMEQENYKLMNALVLNGWTPHVLAYVASFVCPTLDNLPDNVRENITSDLKKAIKSYPSVSVFNGVYNKAKQRTYSFLFTEQAQNFKPLEEWIYDEIESVNIKSVLFQALYTLELFNRIEFRHNDPHAGNVLVEDHSKNATEPEMLSYNIDGITFQVPTKQNFVKLFDFDRSYFNCDSTSETTNPHLKLLKESYRRNLIDRRVPVTAKKCLNSALENNFCSWAGECNRANAKYDTFLMLKSLALKIEACDQLSSALKQTLVFIHDIIDRVPKKYIRNDPPKFPDGYWLIKDDKDYIPTDAEMPSTLDILKSDFFKSFRVPKPKTKVLGGPVFTLPGLKTKG